LNRSPIWNLLTGTATKYLLLAVNLGLGLVLMPFTVRHLGTSQYGLWMLVASLTRTSSCWISATATVSSATSQMQTRAETSPE